MISARIEALASHHDRRAFACGVKALDEYLKRFARQHADTNVSRSYVATDGTTVLGFYSLSMSGTNVTSSSACLTCL